MGSKGGNVPVYQDFIKGCGDDHDAEDDSATSRFFELANSDAVRYVTALGVEVEIAQDRKTQVRA